MWLSITISGTVLASSGSPLWMLWLLAGLGLVGTVVISTFRRPQKSK
jgi:hypothetical protein